MLPSELIKKSIGHNSLKDFYKYVSISQEEAGRKIKKYGSREGEMHASGTS